MKRKMISLLLFLLLASTLLIPVSANSDSARIVDNADLLTAQEETLLEESAYTFRSEYNLDAVVLTVDSLNGKPIAAFADDYYDFNGYGVGTDYSGLILVVSMAERELYISTCGDAIHRYSDHELDTIIDGTAYWLSDGAYYDAFDSFLEMLPLYADVNTYPSDTHSAAPSVNWFISVLSGAVVAGIVILIMVSSMNTKRKQHSAGDYLKSGSYHLRTQQDLFLYSNVSKVRRQQNNNSGSSVHRSSSGRSHGGRGGRF